MNLNLFQKVVIAAGLTTFIWLGLDPPKHPDNLFLIWVLIAHGTAAIVLLTSNKSLEQWNSAGEQQVVLSREEQAKNAAIAEQNAKNAA